MPPALAVAIGFAHTAGRTNGRLDYRQTAFAILAKRFAVTDKLAAISAALREENADNEAFEIILFHRCSPKAYI